MLDDLAAVLHERWKPSQDPTEPDTIVGRWAEDDSTYEVVVPHQLRDQVVMMQNMLSNVYQSMNRHLEEARRIRTTVASLMQQGEKETT